MADIQTLTKNVLDKVTAKHEKQFQEVKAEADEATAAKKAQIDEQTKNRKAHLEDASQAELQRQKQSYVNELRNETLQSKQQLIENVYGEAVTRMNAMDSGQFSALIRGAVSQLNISEAFQVLVGDKSQNILSATDRDQLQSEVANLSFSEETVKNRSGFILASEGMDYNFTFEAIINELKNELAPEIAKRGF